jgi:hypothetical protein
MFPSEHQAVGAKGLILLNCKSLIDLNIIFLTYTKRTSVGEVKLAVMFPIRNHFTIFDYVWLEALRTVVGQISLSCGLNRTWRKHVI